MRHRHEGQEHDHRRSSATCSAASATPASSAATSAGLPYDPELAEEPPSSSPSRSRASRRPTSRCAPPVVAVTSLHPDHLDWHGSVERYYADKLSLCTRPGRRPHDRQRRRAPSCVPRAAQLGPRVEWVRRRAGRLDRGARARSARTTGATRRSPAPASRRSGCPRRATTMRTGRGGRGLRRARQPAARDRRRSAGVTFVDDSLSTNALATHGRPRHLRRAPRRAHRGRCRPRDRLRARWPSASPPAPTRPSWSPCRPTARGSTAAIDEAAARRAARRGARHRRPRRPPSTRPSRGPNRARCSCSRRPRPASGSSANYKERAEAFRRAMEAARRRPRAWLSRPK